VGNVAPEIPKPLPTTSTELTVRAAVPDEVNVRVLVPMVFTVTFPKPMELALSVRLGVAAAVPVPDKETVSAVPPESLLEMVMVPLTAPAITGLKLTRKVID